MLSQSMIRDGLLEIMILSRSESRGLVFLYIPYHTCTVVTTFSSYVFYYSSSICQSIVNVSRPSAIFGSFG